MVPGWVPARREYEPCERGCGKCWVGVWLGVGTLLGPEGTVCFFWVGRPCAGCMRFRVVGGGCCVLFENCIVDAKHL